MKRENYWNRKKWNCFFVKLRILYLKTLRGGVEVLIPSKAEARIAEVIAEGGEITSITYREASPDRSIGGTIYLTTKEERVWKIRKC